ncbi:hypothetical protein IFM89_024312 [Coptis chinensis]|uniref:Pentatricopeptide repeat-containing protein n=1 Tax=Coptis chinensis TaxID=261450 RepID=A0A835H8N2_9MAGN|nr:hypothetical protein IFM89_024312 [Coptis chinensis]
MELERIQPDHYTLPFVIKAFGVLLKVDEGKRVHKVARKLGLVRNVYVGTALMEMYIKFGDLEMGFQLFDEMPKRDIVSWTSMISGYVEHGFYKEGLRVFNEMRLGDDDNKPNWVTVLSVIPACDYSIHSFVVKCGFDSIAEVQTAVLNMYVKGGDVVEGYRLFCEMKEKSLVSWTVMVSGYSQNGYASEALTLFYQMLKMTDLKLDAIIAASVLQACAQLGSLNYGEMIHGYVVRMGPVVGLEAETSLVDMYAKCGSLNAAQRVFGEMRNRNMITWSALISGYGCHGFGSKALDLFEQMKREGFIPDEAAFLSVLSACSHSGLVSEGKEFFNLMRQTYGMSPGLKHYACVIDLLGRAGLIGEAWDMIEGMPFEPDTNIWRSLLSACKIKGNVNVAEYACNQLMELDYDNTDYHVLLANIYASCGKWNEVSKVRSVIRGKGEKKSPGCSYIEVNCKIRNFFAGDKSHPESENLSFIVEMLHTLFLPMVFRDLCATGCSRPGQVQLDVTGLTKLRWLCDEASAKQNSGIKQNSGDPLGPHLYGRILFPCDFIAQFTSR